MPVTAARRRFTAWLALWSVVLGALLPAVEQAALRWHDRADWVEICTSTGMAWVQLPGTAGAEPGDTADDGTAPVGQGTGLSCPWCLSPQGGWALLPVPHDTRWAAQTPREGPPHDGRVALSDPEWPGAHARAPPARA